MAEEKNKSPQNAPQNAPPPAANAANPANPGDVTADQDAVEAALAEAQASIREIQQTAEGQAAPKSAATDSGEPDAEASAPDFTPDFTADAAAVDLPVDLSAIDLLGDVELQVMVELGRTEMMVEDVLRLGQGAVVELDKLAGDPVDVYVNNRLVARGEVLVLNDNFCIRISEIVADLEEQVEAVARQEVGA
jgi:flagellar motor switch protein FliN